MALKITHWLIMQQLRQMCIRDSYWGGYWGHHHHHYQPNYYRNETGRRSSYASNYRGSGLPIFVTMSFEENGRTFTGCTPESMATVLEGLGADAIGVNCSLGPQELLPIVERIIKSTNLPVITQPNAGLPKIIDGEAVYDLKSEEFAFWVEKFVSLGVSIIGGCCGTTPEFTKRLKIGRAHV